MTMLFPVYRFANFYDTASADSSLQYLVAFLVLLSTIKLWHLFRLNPKMNIFSATLERAWNDMSGFLLIIGIMLVAYSIAVSVLFRQQSIFVSSRKSIFLNQKGLK